MNTLTITDLLVYPVKSMRGISLKNASLTDKGLMYDRRWMVVDANDRFITQKDRPQLALIRTKLDDEGVRLSIAGKGEILVPFSLHDGERVNTRVWGSDCQALDQGEKISRWLTRALESEVALRLVRMEPDFHRKTKKAELMGSTTQTVFADIAPFLIAGEESLQKLNQALLENHHQSVPMDRFRPNIVVRGLSPFGEHAVERLQNSVCTLQMRMHCERCVVTTIDQLTAIKNTDQEPFKTLKRINPMPDINAGPAFGHYATLHHGNGNVISVGDRLDAVMAST